MTVFVFGLSAFLMALGFLPRFGDAPSPRSSHVYDAGVPVDAAADDALTGPRA